MKKQLSILLLFIACGQQLPDSKAEHDASEGKNEPVFEYNQEENYYLCKPGDYNENHNKDMIYPLIVYLHGGGGAGDPKDLSLLGYDESAEFKKKYPCFVYAAQTSGSWKNEVLIKQIEKLKKCYRIDNNRIYLIGYSMGGSGSYALANAYYDFNSHLFAGIIRLAGQSQSIVREAIANHTSVWLHIGLQDTRQRINVTRQAYEYIKKYHPNASETSDTVNIYDHPGTTLTLKTDNNEILRKSEYDHDGHGIYHFPFHDDSLLAWLFDQSLQNRK
ncbi:MAG: hypothetical protein KAR19_20200 [Bacteroidales bacterium]|nr:hypothetical protein [Bacteroidales bacterium]